MIRTIISAILILISFLAYSQRKKFEPISVVIIKPREINYDSNQQKYIAKRSAEIKYEINNPVISEEYTAGKKKVTRSSLPVKIEVDYFSYAAFIAWNELEMNCVGLHEPCTIVVRNPGGKSKNLGVQQIAEIERKKYVLDFTRIEILEKNERFQASISIKFYNSTSRQYLIDSTFTADNNEDQNLDREGLGLKADNAMDSAYFNAVSKLLTKIDCVLNCGWIAEEDNLQERRKEMLINNYFNKEFDKSILKKIIPSSDSTINVDIAFQAIFNSDSTKFISFFSEQVTDSVELKRALFGMRDTGYQLATHSYVVYGVEYNNKWYYSTINYGFMAGGTQTLEGRRKDLFNDLQTYHYGFFKEGSIEPYPAFWQTNLFGIVGKPGAYRFPNKEEELNNSPYSGLYVIVAQQLREERRKAEKLILDELTKRYINPLIQSLNATVSSENTFLFPLDMSIILVPLTEKVGENLYKERYYVFTPDPEKNYKVFEWTYFKNSPPKKYGYRLDDLGKLTYWNAAVETIEDKKFWNNYVLLKQGDAYKYLRKVK